MFYSILDRVFIVCDCQTINQCQLIPFVKYEKPNFHDSTCCFQACRSRIVSVTEYVAFVGHLMNSNISLNAKDAHKTFLKLVFGMQVQQYHCCLHSFHWFFVVEQAARVLCPCAPSCFDSDQLENAEIAEKHCLSAASADDSYFSWV